jgi:hypothetical protein
MDCDAKQVSIARSCAETLIQVLMSSSATRLRRRLRRAQRQSAEALAKAGKRIIQYAVSLEIFPPPVITGYQLSRV